MNRPLNSRHASLLNRLADMQMSPYYAVARETLAEAERVINLLDATCRTPAPQPVAWRVRGYSQFKTGTPGPWRYFDGAERPNVNNPEDCDMEPLYDPNGVALPDGGQR